jgi:hypothetical protein
MSPLSALLLDDEYYSFIKDARINFDGLSCISADRIIVLKAKAWLNNTDRKNSGEMCSLGISLSIEVTFSNCINYLSLETAWNSRYP